MIQMSDEDREFFLHNDALTSFNIKLYADIFTEENIVSKKKALTVLDKKFYGYFLEKGKEQFFAVDEFVKAMPFRIVSSQEKDFRNDVFTVITKIAPIKIPAEKKLSFRDMVDLTPAFKHTNPLHFKLYKLCAFTSYVDRINMRVSTEAGFGKDSLMNIFSSLVNSTANLYGATFAKLEYVLYNKLIILNELGNLKKEELINMQEFLLATGAYFNTYTKRTRRTSSTQEQYDISDTSLVIFYNLPEYYTGRAQEYFDQMFTRAVINRFIPFVFEGRIITAFDTILDIDAMTDRNSQVYKDIIATINYYKENKVKNIKFDIPKEIVFGPELMRYERTFNTILKYVGEYAESQNEFNELSLELYNCYKKYQTLIKVDEK